MIDGGKGWRQRSREEGKRKLESKKWEDEGEEKKITQSFPKLMEITRNYSSHEVHRPVFQTVWSKVTLY